jgi:hypothetical protein
MILNQIITDNGIQDIRIIIRSRQNNNLEANNYKWSGLNFAMEASRYEKKSLDYN